MIASASPVSDPYGGLNAPYLFKELESPLPYQIRFRQIGTTGPPEKRTLDPPPIQVSSSTDRKKTNAQICYTRIARKKSSSDTDVGAPEGAVFVSRSFSEYDGTGLNRRSVVYSVDRVNKELEAAELSTVTAASPLDEWRSVELLREWTLDGVLLGRPRDVVESDVLNVCVAGHCSVRNVFDLENVFPMDTCYLCLIADVQDDGMPDGKFTFQYVPCTSRSFSDVRIAGTVLSRSPPTLSDDQLSRVVGAWRLGSVVDSAAVQEKDQHSLTVNVTVQWVDWRVLRETFHEANVASTWLARPGAPPYNPCEVFNWPSFVDANRTAPLEMPSIPARSDAEMKLDKHIDKENLSRCAFVGPVVPPGGIPTQPRKKKRSRENDLFDPEAPPSPPHPGVVRDAIAEAQKKRCRENDLFDPEAPPSPPPPGVVRDAIDEAQRVLAAASSARADWLEYLNTQRGTVTKLEGWVLQLRRDLISYQLRFSKLLRKYEVCAFEDESEWIPALLEAVNSMEAFERGNPIVDTGSSTLQEF
jgi:hypothetical protein